MLTHLLYEAYKLNGNEAKLDQTPLENGRWIFGAKWWPSGTIAIYDEIAGETSLLLEIKFWLDDD